MNGAELYHRARLDTRPALRLWHELEDNEQQAWEHAAALLGQGGSVAERLITSEKARKALQESAIFKFFYSAARHRELYGAMDPIAILGEFVADLCLKREEFLAAAVMKAMLEATPTHKVMGSCGCLDTHTCSRR